MAERKLSKFEKVGLIVCVGIILFYFYVTKIYDPTLKKFIEVRKEYTKFYREVQLLKQRPIEKGVFISLQQQQKELQKAEDEFNKIKNLLLAKKEDVGGILTRINQFAVANNLKISFFNPLDKKDFQDIKDLNKKKVFLNLSYYNFQMEGNFIDFKEFLYDFDQLPKLVLVENLIIEHEGEDEALKITIVLSI